MTITVETVDSAARLMALLGVGIATITLIIMPHLVSSYVAKRVAEKHDDFAGKSSG